MTALIDSWSASKNFSIGRVSCRDAPKTLVCATINLARTFAASLIERGSVGSVALSRRRECLYDQSATTADPALGTNSHVVIEHAPHGDTSQLHVTIPLFDSESTMSGLPDQSITQKLVSSIEP